MKVEEERIGEQTGQAVRPDPAVVGVVAYLKFLAEHPECVDSLEKQLTEYELLKYLLFEFYEDAPVAGRAVLHETAKLLSLNVKEMLEEFERMREPELEDDPDPTANGAAGGLPYEETPRGVVWHRPTKDGEVETLLCNFTARIISDLCEDDGVEVRRSFEIEARQGSRTARVKTSAERFVTMAWVAEALGAKAIIAPGQGLKDHARAAVQWLSSNVVERHVYTHLGWRKIEGQWVYLHAAGGIGSDAPVVEVDLPLALQRYVLSTPLAGEELAGAVRASLRMLDVAPLRVTVPIFCSIWRSALGASDFSLHLSGPTGAGKTELVTLAQQHFGVELDSRNLPGSWGSTGNALESLAFAAKDALLVIDDFAPSGSSADVQRYHREADRVLRAQGNRSGRLRMRSDITLRAAKPPRGLILSSGEDIPRGQSLRARAFALELSKTDANWGKITDCQADAAAGEYAKAMSAFLSWLAARYEQVRENLKSEREELRSMVLQTAHKRTADIVANLALGLRYFLAFAQNAQVFTREEAETISHGCWESLLEAARAQEQHQAASDPARRYVELLSAAISSGKAHLADPSGGEPEEPGSWGWERGTLEVEGWEYHPQGDKIGWIDKDNIYLEPDAAFAAAQKLAHAQGDSLSVTERTLRKRLQESGYLASAGITTGRESLAVQRMIEGKRRSVLHMRKNLFTDSLSTCFLTEQPEHTLGDSEDTQVFTRSCSGFSENLSIKLSRETQEKSNGYDDLLRLLGSGTSRESFSDKKDEVCSETCSGSHTGPEHRPEQNLSSKATNESSGDSDGFNWQTGEQEVPPGKENKPGWDEV
jgi:hypothetical protein